MTPDYRRFLWHCILAALTSPLGALAQASRVGAEFQVNAYTSSDQATPSVAASASAISSPAT